MLGQLLEEFPGKLRIVHKDFPLDFHAGARPAAEAARCAAAVGAFWAYHDLLFLALPDFARDDLIGYARRLGLDREAFAACVDSGRHRAGVEADVAQGRVLGVTGTPTFFVNGQPLIGVQPIELMREIVEDALAEAARK